MTYYHGKIISLSLPADGSTKCENERLNDYGGDEEDE